MPNLNIDQMLVNLGPGLKSSLGLIWSITKILILLGALLFIFWYTSYNVRVMVRKYTKGGRVVASMKRAKKVFNKNLGYPQIQMFGFGKAKKLNEPASDCIVPFQGLIGNSILYDFILKDGIYYPIANVVLGRKYVVDHNANLAGDDMFMTWARENGISVATVGNPEHVIYSLEGSGMEVTRDFEAEQSTLNNLINAAEKYKNRKPIEIAAMYGLMIIIVVGVFISIVYALYKTGQITEAVNQGWQMFGEVGKQVATQNLGPG